MIDVKVGQRFIRRVSSLNDVSIIEVTRSVSGNRRGIVLQVISGDREVGDELGFSFENSESINYTLLEGQDKP